MRTFKNSLIVLTSLCAATGVVAAPTALAVAPRPSAEGHATRHHPTPPVRELDGTYLTTVQLTDAPPGAPASFGALDTFLPDGALLVSSSAPNPSSRGLAHGSWTHLGHRTFTSSFVWFRFDASGLAVGTQRVQRTMRLSPDGSSFTATDVVEVVAPTGAVLATIHGTEAGTLLPS
jgi:hypothetical protein